MGPRASVVPSWPSQERSLWGVSPTSEPQFFHLPTKELVRRSLMRKSICDFMRFEGQRVNKNSINKLLMTTEGLGSYCSSFCRYTRGALRLMGNPSIGLDQSAVPG